MNEQTTKEIQKLSREVGIGFGGLERLFTKCFNAHKKRNPELSEDELTKKALNELIARTRKVRIYGPVTKFQGRILGMGGLIDIVATMRQTCLEMWNKNQQQAISAGYTDTNGNPLDFRKTFSTGLQNQFYGQILPEHSYLVHVFGAGIPVVEGGSTKKATPKKFHILLSDRRFSDKQEFMDKFNLSYDIVGEPVEFQAIDKSNPNDSEYTLNPSVVTRFEVVNSDIPSVDTLIDNFYKDIKIPINKIKEWHAQNSQNMNALFITDGDVVSIAPTVIQKTGNRIISIDDYNLEGGSPVRCWIPDQFVKFGIGSRITIFGRTTEARSLVEGQEKELMINIMSVFVKDLVKPEAKPLKEGDLQEQPTKTETPKKTEPEEKKTEETPKKEEPKKTEETPKKEESTSGEQWV